MVWRTCPAFARHETPQTRSVPVLIDHSQRARIALLRESVPSSPPGRRPGGLVWRRECTIRLPGPKEPPRTRILTHTQHTHRPPQAPGQSGQTAGAGGFVHMRGMRQFGAAFKAAIDWKRTLSDGEVPVPSVPSCGHRWSPASFAS